MGPAQVDRLNSQSPSERPKQHLLVAVAQALQKVAGLGLASAGDAAMFAEPDADRVSPRLQDWVGDLGWDRGELLVTGVMGGCVETVQGAQRLGGPGLVGVGFGGGDELTGDVRAAQPVAAVGVGVVDAQGVVHDGSAEPWEHVELVDGDPAAGVVQQVGGQLLGASHGSRTDMPQDHGTGT